jgi:transcriptional regulator with XRE-family HTH domain
MDQLSKQEVAGLIKEGRIAKGYTQQELADLAKISLRSVQRIENGEVLPRQYTLRVLAEHLEITLKPPVREGGRARENMPHDAPATDAIAGNGATGLPQSAGLSKTRKWILTVASGTLLLLLTGAFLSQSAHFPETDFEGFLLWSGVIGVYAIALFRIWK